VSRSRVPFVRLGYLATIQSGVTVDANRDYGSESVTLPYLRVANVQDGHLDLGTITEIRVPGAVARSAMLRRGDVLMTEGGDLDKLGRGTVWNGEIENCLHQNHVFAVRPDRSRLKPEYLALITQTSYARAYFESTGTKTTNLASTSSSKIRDFAIPFADLDEQRRIIDFLDAEIAKIDLLASLRTEQSVQFDKREASWRSRLFRQSKSGILTRVKYLLRAKPRYGVLVPQFVDDGIPFIRVNNLPSVVSREGLAKIPRKLSAQYSRTVTMRGDILVSVVGSLGKTTVITEDLVGANTARAVAVLRLKQKYASSLFATWVGTPEFERQALLATGADSAQPTLGMEDLANFSVRWPADDAEQKEMTEAADEHRTQTDAAHSLINRQLALLAERRQALITAAVTGQIDVTTAGGVAI
jgi:type I restriction enzyme, S subunit